MKAHSHTLAFMAIAFFMAIFAFCSFDGFYFYDDYAYMYYAQQIISGEYQISNNDIFAHRWGLIFPLALSLKCFGTSEWAVCIVPILASLGSLYLVYLFSKNLPHSAGLYALCLFGLDFYTLFFANKIYPDVLLTTFALASLYFLWHRDRQLYGVYFILCSFGAFLCKELIIYLVPFYIYVCVQDLRNRQNQKFWLIASLLCFCLAVSYLSVYQLFTGDYLFRFKAIEQGHYTVSFSYFDKPFLHTLRRISYEPLLMFADTTLIIPLAGAILFLFFLKKNQSQFLAFVAYALASGLLMFWLMTTSFSAYNPIGLFPRHILFLLPLGAILSAVSLQYPTIRFYTALSFFLSALWTWQSVGYKTAVLYLLLGIWLIARSFSFFSKKINLWNAAWVVILLLHPLYTMLKPSETGYWAEKEIFEKYILPIEEPCIIYTDDKLLTGHLWYFRFAKKEAIQFKDLAELEKNKAANLKKYVLINSYSIAYFSQIGFQLPDFVSKTPDNWQKIAEKGGVKLYLLE